MKIFISGTNTNVGKTFITNKIAMNLINKGIKIGISKPIETGVIDIPLDAMLHLKTQNIKCNINDICFYQFSLPASPFVADKENIIDIQRIKINLNKLEKKCDILLIEGAGGLFVPIKKDYFMIDLIKELNTFCFIVSDSKLGCINNLISSRKILGQYNINFKSIVNIFDDDFMKTSYPFVKTLDNNFIYQFQEKEIIEFILQLLNF